MWCGPHETARALTWARVMTAWLRAGDGCAVFAGHVGHPSAAGWGGGVFQTVSDKLGELSYETGSSSCPRGGSETAPVAFSVLLAPIGSKKQELLG